MLQSRTCAAALLLLAWVVPSTAQAQIPQLGQPLEVGRPFQFQGEISSFGELYGVSGREPRRPGSTAGLVFRPTMYLTRHVKVGFDFLLSTEGNDAGTGAASPTLGAGRQRLNQLGISPTWNWGTLHLGDFADAYTPLTYGGVRVRGGGFYLTPGLLRVGTFGGRARNAVIGGATNGSYDRNIYGGKIGIGREESSFFDVILVRAADDESSLPPPSDTTFVDPRLIDDPTVDPDTLPVGTLVNPLSVTPQENLVIAASGRLSLLESRIQLSGELSGSAYSRDVRASELDNETVLAEFPGVLRKLFTPRLSSNVGLAYTAALELRFSSWSASAGYEYIDPGYVALGVGSLLNDQKVWRLEGSKRFGRLASLRLDGSRQNDNLIGQKSFTTTRDRVGGGVSLRPVARWTSTIRANYVAMHNEVPSGDERQIAYTNWILGTNQTLSLGREGLLRSIGLGYNYRTSGDDNPVRQASSLTSHAGNVRVVLKPLQNVSLTPSVGVVSTVQAQQSRKTRETYSLAAQLRALSGKWTTTVSFGTSQDRAISMVQGRLNSQYRVTATDAVTLSLRASSFRNAPDPFGADGDFRELTMNLRWVHRFQGGRSSDGEND